ncbi:GNAT family N-acetyltransferase [Porifericola rhodea]|uniref:GNAT family N-acetyltransferase n=1 Tax=Porifericola rhodea TaxID=930972 RepID=UPI0026664C10|nr:GNAT family N-acetyltransferase [Porifericola rhodea]WKN31877.1 GNAT family N-acetyltransferase [Porifericola rhodea]
MIKDTAINIRRAQPEDLEAITHLFKETVLNINTKDYSEKQVEAWAARYEKTQRWSDRIKHQYFLLAEYDDEIVGFGSITSDGYLDTLFAHKAHQKEGIGSSLLEKLLEYVKEIGRSKVHLDASLTARSFFERKGFRMIKPQQKVIDGVVFVNFMMVRTLDE